MGKVKQIELKRKSHKAVSYMDRINSAEIAATIIEHVHDSLGDGDLLGQALIGGEVNVEDFAAILDDMFDVTALNELINTTFGRGVLFGMYLRIKEESLAREEVEALDEME